ncbi:hypothetical protein K8P10_001378 [Leucobacter sp. Psy1]|uniref:PD-(D/E)XK motif protein n=1 Tax=Leucobacter sp. Psy1 TaxID=2875729 RepID=UPI001CD4E06A|nr:PD-(D/E)XK motif protein [Leucobacter sp. Psy1]UBH05867.1 hypothetical protein K8P10_001378 [Leucobacter sp. Psy1]
MDDESNRVMTPETLEQYVRATVPTRHPLSESPVCVLIIEPDSRRLKLRTPATNSYPELGSYDRLSFDVMEEPGEDGVWFELGIDVDGMAYEGYSVIMSVVDQLEAGRPFRHSVEDALASFRELLAKRRKLSEEQETGLFGELGLFAHLVGRIGEEAATAAWLGPEHEEHDFVLPEFDAEVKTTTSEGRIHVIGSATQLSRSPGRPLYLVSIQVTAAGASTEGETLPDRVRRVRGLLDRSRRLYDERLRSIGWEPSAAEDLYTRRFIDRSVPRAYAVTDHFPAIDHEGIASIIERPELVVGLVYRIDVTGLEAAEPPTVIEGFCERGKRNGS